MTNWPAEPAVIASRYTASAGAWASTSSEPRNVLQSGDKPGRPIFAQGRGASWAKRAASRAATSGERARISISYFRTRCKRQADPLGDAVRQRAHLDALCPPAVRPGIGADLHRPRAASLANPPAGQAAVRGPPPGDRVTFRPADTQGLLAKLAGDLAGIGLEGHHAIRRRCGPRRTGTRPTSGCGGSGHPSPGRCCCPGARRTSR